jgi:hypothetical protein
MATCTGTAPCAARKVLRTRFGCALLSRPIWFPDSAHGQPAVDQAEQTPELGPVLMVDEGATFFVGRAKDQGNSLLAGPPLNPP